MKKIELRALFIVPSIIEEIVREADGLRMLHNLQFLCYAGGPLSKSTGDRLCSVLDLCQFYGMTETLSPPQLVPKSEDWAYMEWHPDFGGVMEQSDNGTFELVYHSDRLDEKSSALLYNLPGVKELRTKDLFEPHPKKSNLWRFYGRKDDIIVLSNGYILILYH